MLEGEKFDGYRLVEKDLEDQERDSPKVAPPSDPILFEVKFFDDDDFDVFRVRNLKSLKKYSGNKEKIKLIKAGIRKFSGDNSRSKKGGAKAAPSAMGIDNLGRQSQFIKDIEMAEVMTDNDPKVAEILTSIVYLDEEPNPAGELAKNPEQSSSESSSQQTSKNAKQKKGKNKA